jgi:3'(2'), 5'-bisphosphate nucleotidase
VDPIDGTSQFIDADAHDFCTAIAILRDGQPYASYICLYEVANHALQTTSFVPTHMVRLEGKPVIPPVRNATMRASVTGKRTESWPDLDRYLEQHNYLVKKKATSQTIDLLRTCQVVPALMPSFDLFYRQDQRLWDGLPGIAVAQSLGMTVTTLHPNEPHLPLSTAKLHMRNPEFKSTLVANKDLVDDIIRDLLSGVRS